MSLISKGETRKRVKTLIASFTDEIRLKKSLGVSENILHFLNHDLPKLNSNYSSDGIIGGFAPLHDEVDWLVGLESLGSQFAFPGTCEKGNMIFFKTHPDDLIESSVFGVVIKSPPEDSAVVTPDLLLVPGLAFGLKGERLGRGKGFYDKYLENFNGLKIGICTSEQVIEGIPLEAHDIPMDGLITDKKSFCFKARLP